MKHCGTCPNLNTVRCTFLSILGTSFVFSYVCFSAHIKHIPDCWNVVYRYRDYPSFYVLIVNHFIHWSTTVSSKICKTQKSLLPTPPLRSQRVRLQVLSTIVLEFAANKLKFSCHRVPTFCAQVFSSSRAPWYPRVHPSALATGISYFLHGWLPQACACKHDTNVDTNINDFGAPGRIHTEKWIVVYANIGFKVYKEIQTASS